jgi:hypothetical protein
MNGWHRRRRLVKLEQPKALKREERDREMKSAQEPGKGKGLDEVLVRQDQSLIIRPTDATAESERSAERSIQRSTVSDKDDHTNDRLETSERAINVKEQYSTIHECDALPRYEAEFPDSEGCHQYWRSKHRNKRSAHGRACKGVNWVTSLSLSIPLTAGPSCQSDIRWWLRKRRTVNSETGDR